MVLKTPCPSLRAQRSNSVCDGGIAASLTDSRNDERGNAIFFLFLAVALFGLISYAFLQGTRGNLGMIMSEAKEAKDTKIQDYNNSIKGTVTRLHARGCTDAMISYETPTGGNPNPDAPTDGSCHIFRIVKYDPDIGGGPAVPAGMDVTPDPFTFPDRTGQYSEMGGMPVTHNSDIIPILGIDAPATVSIGGGTGTATAREFRICGDSSCSTVIRPWGTSNTTITNGQYVQIHFTTTYATHSGLTSTLTLNVGTGSDTWSVQTSIICTVLRHMDLMPENIYNADIAFVRKHISISAIRVYHLWGGAVAAAVPDSPAVRAIVMPITNAWAEHVAYLEGAVQKDNAAGRWLYDIFLPAHEFIGSVLYPEDGLSEEKQKEELRKRILEAEVLNANK